MTPCTVCDFVFADLAVADVPERVRSFGPRYGAALAGIDGDSVRRRPAADVWSALEYAGHVRDVLLVQRDRFLLALNTDGPSFVPMYRDERVSTAGYAADDPQTVIAEIGFAANLLARLLDRLSDDQRARTCVYNYPTPTEVDLAWMARHTVHEAEHHLKDIKDVLTQVDRGMASQP